MTKLFSLFKKKAVTSEQNQSEEYDLPQEMNEKSDKVDINPPYLFIAGYFDGADKKDAIQWVRNSMENMCSSLDHSGYAVVPFLDGFAYEIHEGGSRHSYLKWIIDALAKSNNGKIAIRTATNVVSIEQNSKGFVTLLIPESSHHKEPTLQPEAQGMLTSYKVDKTKYVTALMYFFLFSCSLLIFAAILKVIVWSATKDMGKELLAQKMEQIPILHWPKDKLPENAYIDKLTFANGRWNILSKSAQSEQKVQGADQGQAAMPSDPAQIPASPKVIQVPVVSGDKIISKPVTAPANP